MNEEEQKIIGQVGAIWHEFEAILDEFIENASFGALTALSPVLNRIDSNLEQVRGRLNIALYKRLQETVEVRIPEPVGLPELYCETHGSWFYADHGCPKSESGGCLIKENDSHA